MYSYDELELRFFYGFEGVKQSVDDPVNKAFHIAGLVFSNAEMEVYKHSQETGLQLGDFDAIQPPDLKPVAKSII